MSKCKTEYITKEQALEAIKGKMWPGELEAAIKEIPAADDAPTVAVPCENCKYKELDAMINLFCVDISR